VVFSLQDSQPKFCLQFSCPILGGGGGGGGDDDDDDDDDDDALMMKLRADQSQERFSAIQVRIYFSFLVPYPKHTD
jgi:hypothetical protein